MWPRATIDREEWFLRTGFISVEYGKGGGLTSPLPLVDKVHLSSRKAENGRTFSVYNHNELNDERGKKKAKIFDSCRLGARTPLPFTFLNYCTGQLVTMLIIFSDITDVRYVINYDFPQCCEDYVHRVGRTARGDDVGTSYTFMTNKDGKMVKNLIEILEESGQKVPDDLRALGHTNGKFGGRGGKSINFLDENDYSALH